MDERAAARALRVSGGVAAVVAAVGAGAAASYAWRNTTYSRRAMTRIRKAGVIEKQALVNGSVINYGEGPDHGTPLLLIHGQMTSWESYAPVLPALAERFHVYAVDCYGHGASAHDPHKYTAVANGRDLQQFITEVIGQPVIVSGLSSGGLLAAWLAANAPGQVSAVILEDPPLFSTLPERFPQTAGYDVARVAHAFLGSGETDFAVYYATHASFLDYLGGLKDAMLTYPVTYRAKHPDRPLNYWFLPPLLNALFDSLDDYDPRFGQAFYDASWLQGFDQAETLARIRVPAVLIHTNWFIDARGILMGAMSGEDAARAQALIPDVEFHKVDATHSFHTHKPRQFLKIVLDFTERLRTTRPHARHPGS